MTLKDPIELLRVFDIALTEIKGSSPLASSDRRRIADDLAEVYNYVSASIPKPSFTNAIYARSAHDAKQEIQLEQERELLRDHQQFVENNFDKAEQCLRSIQLYGYAAFFALWVS